MAVNRYIPCIILKYISLWAYTDHVVFVILTKLLMVISFLMILFYFLYVQQKAV